MFRRDRHPTGRRLVLGLVTVAATAGWGAATGESGLVWRVDGRGRGVPATDGRSVFFLTADHAVVALDLDTGVRRWRTATGGAGPQTSGLRVLVAGSRVIAGDDHLVAFERDSGRRRWIYGADGRPGVHLGGTSGRAAFAGSANGVVHAVDLATGAPRWTARLAGGETVFAPAVSASMVVAAVSDGEVVALDMATGRERWRRSVGSSVSGAAGEGIVGPAILAGDLVLVAARDGRLFGLEAATGRLRWRLPPVSSRPDGRREPPVDLRPLAVAGRRLVAGSLTGLIVAYDLGSMQEIWRRSPEPSSVAFEMGTDGELVYVPFLNGRLLVVEARGGAVVARLGGEGDDLRWPPLVYDSRLFLTGLRAGFAAFERPAVWTDP